MNYKNQYTIKINLDKIKAKEKEKRAFLIPTIWQAHEVAFSILNGNEYKLYMYIMKQAGRKQENDYYAQWFFSPADIYYKCGLSESTIRRAKQTLIDYKFLIPESKTTYLFDPMPDYAIQCAEQAEAERRKKQLLPSK